MDNGDEVDSLKSVGSPTPAGHEGGPDRSSQPTPAAVLEWIARAGGEPWFPSRHAADTATDRDALDDPLHVLRAAGLVRIETWLRGQGQGYVLTDAGKDALATGARIPAPTTGTLTLEAPTEVEVTPVAMLEGSSRPILIVPILLAVNLLWFFVGLVIVIRQGDPVWPYLSEGNKDVLHQIGAVSGADLLRGEWWRLGTSCFVHIGGAHLLLNLFALVVIGPRAELQWGRWRLLTIYLLSGLAGSCLAMAVKPDSLLAGASGAIWGLLMALLAWFKLFRPYLPAEVVTDSTRRLMVVIVLNALFSFTPGISWQAHLGGAVAGFLGAGLLNALRVGDRGQRKLALALLLMLAAGCIVGLAAAMRWSAPWDDYRQRLANEQAWQAADQTRQAAKAAAEAFDRDVLPLLNRLSPDRVRPIEEQVGYLLIRPQDRRNAKRVAALRTQLTELKTAADTATGLLNVPPTGVDALDRHRERSKVFTQERSRSFTLALALLDSPDMPDDARWVAWISARRTADELFRQFLAVK